MRDQSQQRSQFQTISSFFNEFYHILLGFLVFILLCTFLGVEIVFFLSCNDSGNAIFGSLNFADFYSPL